jgi:SAM-dependent methyltransferase
MIQDLEARPVNVIVAHGVLHHCFPLENLMPTLLRWLKPGGVFVTKEPVSYLPLLTWMRNRSGIPTVPLDEGERPLNGADMNYVTSFLSEPRVVHFHVLGRLARVWPRSDRFLRRIDQEILRVPMAKELSGVAVFVGRR